MQTGTTRFLTAEWKYLVMLNYEVEPEVLAPFVPAGTELDQWNGKTYVSMVGFQFMRTKLMGVSVPFHSDFEEVNLRFYVRRQSDDGWRRAVVFIKELVPSRAIAWTARTFYNENYVALPMKHEWQRGPDGTIQRVSYSWRFNRRENRLEITTSGQASGVGVGSIEEFITEHYWGYARQRDGGTVEYQVEHPRWRIWRASSSLFECEVEGLYGPSFARFLKAPPVSAFLAEGSEVTVYKGRQIA